MAAGISRYSSISPSVSQHTPPTSLLASFVHRPSVIKKVSHFSRHIPKKTIQAKESWIADKATCKCEKEDEEEEGEGEDERPEVL